MARTYWNYGRAAAEAGVQIRRVGVVLNGHSHLSAPTHEAHDYALHRFRVDSDLALDNVSTEAGTRLRELLARTGKVARLPHKFSTEARTARKCHTATSGSIADLADSQ